MALLMPAGATDYGRATIPPITDETMSAYYVAAKGPTAAAGAIVAEVPELGSVVVKFSDQPLERVEPAE